LEKNKFSHCRLENALTSCYISSWTQGTIEWAVPSELAYLSRYSNRNVGVLNGGFFGVLNWEKPDSYIPEKQTHLLTLGAPALAT
jgi:hypothetical protein